MRNSMTTRLKTIGRCLALAVGLIFGIHASYGDPETTGPEDMQAGSMQTGEFALATFAGGC